MSTQPRISAPIARVRITTAERRRRRASGVGGGRPTGLPLAGEVTEEDEAGEEIQRPRFYPFALRSDDAADD